MIRRVLSLSLIVALFCGTHAYAIWRVEFESKTVSPSEIDVELNLKVYWDIDLYWFTVPVIVRSVSGGAFWTPPLPVDTAFALPVGVTWNWSNQWVTLTEELRPGVPWGSCSPDGDTGYDGISPDHFVINVQGYGGDSTPAEPAGRDVVTITFDVTGSLGQFEFDTACFSTDLNSIFMVDDGFPPVDHGPAGTGEATFGKGVITIAHDPPTIYCPRDQTIILGDQLNLTVTATDDGFPTTPLSMIAQHFPTWTNFTDNGDNTGTLTGAPGFGDIGQNTGRFIADDGDLADTCYVTITVVQCDCLAKGDVNDDSSADPLDVTCLVNYVYHGWLGALAERPFCPYPAGDMDCWRGTDPLDVAYLVNYVYKGLDAICDGCDD